MSKAMSGKLKICYDKPGKDKECGWVIEWYDEGGKRRLEPLNEIDGGASDRALREGSRSGFVKGFAIMNTLMGDIETRKKEAMREIQDAKTTLV